MQYIQDAFVDPSFTKDDIKNLPVMFRFLERNNTLEDQSRKHFYDKVGVSTEFNTTRLPLLPTDKPISKII